MANKKPSCSSIIQKGFWPYNKDLVKLANSKDTINLNEMSEELKYYLYQLPIKIYNCPIKYRNQLNNFPLNKLVKKYLL